MADTTVNVTSTADSGLNTLRQAITDLNLIAGSHTITFGVTGTITLASALPAINKNMTITGPGLSSLTVSGNSLYRVFNINTGFTVSITGLTISNGKITGNGGGIYNAGSSLTVTSCTFTGCYATSIGGAIFSLGQFSVTNCTFASNTASSGGSGIWASGSSPATVGNCTFSGNTGTAYSGTVSFTIYNCTFNGNTGLKAGAISTGGSSSSAILSSTISGNTATDTSGFRPAGGGIYHSEYCSLTIKNSIISGNTGTYADVGGYNSSSIPVAKVANIVGSAYNWSGDVSAASLGTLGALQNNGGTTLTMAVPAGSSAIGAGNATASNASPVSGLDQRGTARSATTPTIGAYEYTGSSPPTVSSISPSTGTALGGTSVTITGANLTGATGVTIGGVAATSVTVVNSTTITATTPAGSVGTASVLVTTSIGTNSANTLFTYFIPPNTVRIKRSNTTSVSPTSLLEGELAANIVDKKVWIGDSSKTPVLISDYKAMGTVTSVAMTVPTGLTVTGSPVTNAATLAITLASGYSIPTTASQTNWDSAYTQRLQWDGGSTNLVAATGRTSLGATTVGSNMFTLVNPTAVTFPRFNLDNTVSALDAATFRTAIGVGASLSPGGSSGQFQYNNGSGGFSGTTALTYQAVVGDDIGVYATSSSQVALVVQGAVSQTSNLFELRASNATVLLYVTQSGGLYVSGGDIVTSNSLVIKNSSNGRTITIARPSTFPASYTLTLPQNAGTANQALVTNGSGTLSWSSGVLYATNLDSGGAGQIPYNTAVGATSFLAAGTAGQVLQSNGTSAPSWTSPSSAGSNIFLANNFGGL
jgi:parallel beta-helix repeat protein